MSSLPTYSYRGARALVLLHEQQLRKVLETWRQAKAVEVSLPKTDDSDYQSLETLLRHILRAARGYMTWICEQLELPDPLIMPAPEAGEIEAEADQYLEHLLDRWRTPLASVPEERFHRPEYESRWKVVYCIDAMLEHAVMHPLRHQLQLVELMRGRG